MLSIGTGLDKIVLGFPLEPTTTISSKFELTSVNTIIRLSVAPFNYTILVSKTKYYTVKDVGKDAAFNVKLPSKSVVVPKVVPVK